MAPGAEKTRLKFFSPDARILSKSEIAALPAEKKQAVATLNKEGVWLEVHCPDASCVGDDGLRYRQKGRNPPRNRDSG